MSGIEASSFPGSPLALCVVCDSFPPSPSLQYELAVGRFPYPVAKDVDVFKQLELVVEGAPPRVPDTAPLTPTLRDFIHKWSGTAQISNSITTA